MIIITGEWTPFGGLFGLFFWFGFLQHLMMCLFNEEKKDTPLDILKHRFAVGQITITEYTERKKILENDLAH